MSTLALVLPWRRLASEALCDRCLLSTRMLETGEWGRDASDPFSSADCGSGWEPGHGRSWCLLIDIFQEQISICLASNSVRRDFGKNQDPGLSPHLALGSLWEAGVALPDWEVWREAEHSWLSLSWVLSASCLLVVRLHSGLISYVSPGLALEQERGWGE